MVFSPATKTSMFWQLAATLPLGPLAIQIKHALYICSLCISTQEMANTYHVQITAILYPENVDVNIPGMKSYQQNIIIF